MSDAPEIVFTEENHEYAVDGIVRPSVTQILKDLGFIDFSMVPGRILEAAKVRGKAVHAAVHFLEEADLDWSTVHPAVKPYVEAYALMKEETGWKAELRERAIFNAALNYAGQLDGFGSMSKLGFAEILPDYKSGVPQSAAAYQTAAYAAAIEKPYVSRCSIHLKANGKYKIIWHKDRSDVAGWRSIVTTFHLKHNGNGKN